jgi:hypothetical protein
MANERSVVKTVKDFISQYEQKYVFFYLQSIKLRHIKRNIFYMSISSMCVGLCLYANISQSVFHPLNDI